MSLWRGLLCAICLAVLVPASPSGASWWNGVRQEFCAQKSQKHPRSKSLILRLPVDALSGAEVCFAYAHRQADQPNRGAVKVEVQLVRQSSPSGPIILIDEIRFGRLKVQEQAAVACAFTPRLEAGDLAVFSFKFSRMPRLIVGGESDLSATFQFSGTLVSRE